MSLAQALSTYINLQFLIGVGFMGLFIFFWVFKKLNVSLSAIRELHLHYRVLQFIIFLTFLHPWLPRQEMMTASVHVWTAPSLKQFSGKIEPQGYVSVPTPRGPSMIEANDVMFMGFLISVAVLLCGGFFLFRDLRTLQRMRKSSFVIRKIGRVHIYANDSASIPFSYWLPFSANVVLPQSLLNRAWDYRMAVQHELQHHRQADTRWVYVLWGFKVVCFINPMIYLWNRWIAEIQEFACDESLVEQGKVQSQAYARCLIEVAETALYQKSKTFGANRLTFLVKRHLLKRRIERMFTKTSIHNGRALSFFLAVSMILVMGTTATASRSLVQDRRVSLEQAQFMAARAQRQAGFPIVVNDLVLNELNRYLGTPEGRELMKNSLARMENYRAVVEQKLQQYGVPEELMAMPLIESGYQNLPANQNSAWPTWKAAGIWQFIASTARNFGLRVDEKKDDRLDVVVLTDAAMRYLRANQLRFKDWQLSALAFNMGENAVQKGMDALETRDPWVLIRNGYEGDKAYLPKLMAAILIMKNPDSVR